MTPGLIENVRGHYQRGLDKVRQLAGMVDLAEKYRDTFTSPDGQVVLRHLMKVGHITTTTFVPGDPTATAFREGQRHLVLSILRAVNRDTTELIKQVEQTLEDKE